jgi:hypothetical protein
MPSLAQLRLRERVPAPPPVGAPATPAPSARRPDPPSLPLDQLPDAVKANIIQREAQRAIDNVGFHFRGFLRVNPVREFMRWLGSFCGSSKDVCEQQEVFQLLCTQMGFLPCDFVPGEGLNIAQQLLQLRTHVVQNLVPRYAPVEQFAANNSLQGLVDAIVHAIDTPAIRPGHAALLSWQNLFRANMRALSHQPRELLETARPGAAGYLSQDNIGSLLGLTPNELAQRICRYGLPGNYWARALAVARVDARLSITLADYLAMPPQFRSDRELALILLKSLHSAYPHVDASIKRQPNFTRAAFNANAGILGYVDYQNPILNEVELIMGALLTQGSGAIGHYCEDTWLTDQLHQRILAKVHPNGSWTQHQYERLRDTMTADGYEYLWIDL